MFVYNDKYEIPKLMEFKITRTDLQFRTMTQYVDALLWSCLLIRGNLYHQERHCNYANTLKKPAVKTNRESLVARSTAKIWHS